MYLTATKRKLLLREDGYRLALEYKDPEDRPQYWPGDHEHPKRKNLLKLVDKDGLAKEYFITSARVTTIAREIRGGNMGNRHGIVCALDGRGITQFVKGGGKVQPDFDGTSNTRLWFGEDCELVRGAAVSENHEELDIPFLEKEEWDREKARDHKRWGNRYFLFGLRLITETLKAPDPNDPTKEVVVGEQVKTENGLECADALFIAISNVRLGNFEGQKGETGTRFVKPASELLRRLPYEEEKKYGKILPVAQAFALAMAITCGKEIFGANAPEPLKEIIAEGETAAARVATHKFYAPNFIRCIQEEDWVV